MPQPTGQMGVRGHSIRCVAAIRPSAILTTMSAAGALDLPATAYAVPKTRISPKVRLAVRLMVEQARKRKDAAQEAGLTDDALYRALQRPDVIAYRTQLFEVLRTSAASRTIARAEKLADDAESEHVQLQANTWLAGIEGISPVTKTENTSTHRHLLAGLVIVRGAEPVAAEPARLIDGQPHEVRKTCSVNRIGNPVPHPNQRNTLLIEAKPPVIRGSGSAEGGGQK